MGGFLKDREVSLKDKLLKGYKDGIYLLYAVITTIPIVCDNADRD